MKALIAIVALCLLTVADIAAQEAFYQEQIDDAATLRSTRFEADNGDIYWETSLPGNSEFGQAVTALSYVHSVINIDPPLLPDGTVERVRLKLFLRNHANSDLVVTVDSLELDNFHRRQFLIGPEDGDSLSVQESILQDGEIEIVLSATSLDKVSKTFVLFRSVMDVVYSPAIPLDAPGDHRSLPEGVWLSANYPNPFNPSTTIEYSLPARSPVRVEVLNTLGQTVKTLVNEVKPAGTHQVVWDGRDQDGATVASGIYYYRIEADGFVNAKKMIYMK